MFDTHTHLYLNDFDSDREEVIQRALDAGVKKLLLPNIDTSTIENLLALANKYKTSCLPMAGLHPGSVKDNYIEELNKLEFYLSNFHFIAIGEIGIDLYWERKYQIQQEKAFGIQLEWANKYKLPVVIHARDSFKEIYKVLDQHKKPGLKGVFHSFTGTGEDIQKIREYDFYFGINGIVSFKNSDLRNLLRQIPVNRLLLETDSPFLAPTPKRGRRNESSYIVYIYEFVAKELGMNVSDLQRLTTKNAIELFNI